jgi:hypothetical protein
MSQIADRLDFDDRHFFSGFLLISRRWLALADSPTLIEIKKIIR